MGLLVDVVGGGFIFVVGSVREFRVNFRISYSFECKVEKGQTQQSGGVSNRTAAMR